MIMIVKYQVTYNRRRRNDMNDSKNAFFFFFKVRERIFSMMYINFSWHPLDNNSCTVKLSSFLSSFVCQVKMQGLSL